MTTVSEVPVAAGLDEQRLRRRHLGTAPGDGLILAADALAPAMISQAFLAESGLSAEDVALPTTLVVPVPLHHSRADVPDSTPQAWANPLMWLPHRWRDDLGGWCSEVSALRIGWELIASGLFHRDTGFVDVLYAYGVDIDTEQGDARVRQWIAGGADELLDSVDVTEMLVSPTDESWALHKAEADREAVTLASQAAACRSIRSMAASSLQAKTIVEDTSVILALLASRLRSVETEGSVVYHVYRDLAEQVVDEADAEEALVKAIGFCDLVVESTDDVLIALLSGEEDLDDEPEVQPGDAAESSPDTDPGVIPDFEDEGDR